MNKETGKLPTPVGRQKVEMSDKRQQINLKLDPELAQALREMKQGHDESLSEVVIRLLRKLVRLNPAGARGARFSNTKGASGGGGFGANRRGKTMGSGRSAPRGAVKGKPFLRREAPVAGGSAAEDGQREAPGAWAPPRAARPRTGKVGRPFRPQPFDGSSKPWRRDVESPKRTSARGPRSNRTNDERATAERVKRPRKAKGRRSSSGR